MRKGREKPAKPHIVLTYICKAGFSAPLANKTEE
jgi:hypothetical protein